MSAAAVGLNTETGLIDLNQFKRNPDRVIHETPGASLIDIGDGVLCAEFHSAGNVIDENVFAVLDHAQAVIPGNYAGLVLGNQSTHFSAGVNLRWLLRRIEEQDQESFYEGIKRYQRTAIGLRTSPFPTIAAPFGITYGSALELVMFCDHVQTVESLAARLPQIAFGVIPTLGGISELYARSIEHFGAGHLQDALRFAFDIILDGKQSIDADDACRMLFLHESDRLSASKARLLSDAKARVLELAAEYQPPLPRANMYVLGAIGYSTLEASIEADIISGRLPAGNSNVALALARVMTGGASGLPRIVSQQELQALEAEVFTELVFHPDTRERIERVIIAGKPFPL